MAINEACYNLRKNHGIQAQLPEKVTITVDVVKTFNDVTRTTTSQEPDKTVNSTETNPSVTETRITSPGGQQTITSESGGDSNKETREYDEFDVEDPS